MIALTSHTLSKLTAFVILALCAPLAASAEMVLERTAVDKMLVQTLFKEDGRRVLIRTACEAYIETPTSTLKNGRIIIRFHLTAKVGVPAGKVCVGTTLQTWSVVSGKPVAQGAVVRLEDIQVEDVEDAKVRFLLKTGFAPAIPHALELDMRKAVGTMLKASSPQMESTVDMIEITQVLAENDKLAVKFDFKLVAK